MTVIFEKWTNKLPAIVGLGTAVLAVCVVFVVWFWFSPRHTDVGYQPHQPVFYSHKKHVGELGMDCRYCHRMVEDGPHATIPDTETCMNCHKVGVLPDSKLLEPLKESYQTGAAMKWIKVHMLPDYAYFHHGAHVRAGVGCASCHGRIDQMEEVRQAEPLSMSWCVDCHRDPGPHLRPLDKVFDMTFQPDPVQGAKFLQERKLNPPTHCSACHR